MSTRKTVKPTAPESFTLKTRIAILHQIKVSLDDPTDKLQFFRDEAVEHLKTADPMDENNINLRDFLAKVRSEIYRRYGQ